MGWGDGTRGEGVKSGAFGGGEDGVGGCGEVVAWGGAFAAGSAGWFDFVALSTTSFTSFASST